MNEHDVDHVKPGKVAKKKKSLSAVFKKYSSCETPDVLDPVFSHCSIKFSRCTGEGFASVDEGNITLVIILYRLLIGIENTAQTNELSVRC